MAELKVAKKGDNDNRSEQIKVGPLIDAPEVKRRIQRVINRLDLLLESIFVTEKKNGCVEFYT